MDPRYIVFAALLALAGCSKSPESTVESFYRAMEAGEQDKAIKLLHPSAIMSLGEAKLRAGLELTALHFKECGGISTLDVKLAGGTEIERRGTVTVTYKGNCKPAVEGVKLARLDGQWRLAP